MIKRMKKMLAKLLTLGMTMSLLIPTTMVAKASNNVSSDVQIVQTGEKIYYLASEEEASADNFDVWTSKTIAGTENEDEFEITLQVGSTVKAMNDDVAVLLVMDVSGSMNKNADGAYYEYYFNASNYKQAEGKKQIDYLKEAAEEFMTNLVAGAGDNQRMVSIVEFGNNAKTVLDWTDANNNGELSSEVKNAINDVKVNFIYDQKEVTADLEDAKLVSFVSSGDVVSGGNGVNVKYCLYTDEDGSQCTLTEDHGHCEICGMVESHQHCSYKDCDKMEEHTHTEDVYDGDTNGGPMADRLLQSIQKVSTNMEGGLMLARNLLNAGSKENGPIEGINNVYVILLSDGQPTSYVDSQNYSTTETDFVIGTLGTVQYAGSYSKWEDLKDITYGGEDDDIAIAEDIKEKAGLFTILYGYEGEQKLGYSWRGKHANHSLAETTVKDWLIKEDVDYVGVDRIYSSIAIDGLNSVFDQINDRINILSKAWTITDEMGNIQLGDDVSFEGFTLNGEYAEVTQATSSVNSTITWKLGAMEPEAGSGGMADPYIYTLKYKVNLDSSNTTVKEKTLAYEENNANDAVWTNNAAVLRYIQVRKNELEKMDNDDIAANLKTAAFSKPSVKGLYADYTFVKKNQETGAIMEGVGFTLYDTEGKACTEEVFSEANGTVKFESIPKGEYELAETSVPEGMQTLDSIKFKVSWGVVSTLEGEAMPNTIYNEPKPDYKVTVNYLDKETGEKIAASYQSGEILEGGSYDVTDKNAIAIEGYTYDSTDGDALSGIMDSDKVINVYYVKKPVEIPKDDDPKEEETTNPAEEADKPDDSNREDNSEELVEIEDPSVLQAGTPKTGDPITIWLAMFALSGAGLAVIFQGGKKRKQED